MSPGCSRSLLTKITYGSFLPDGGSINSTISGIDRRRQENFWQYTKCLSQALFFIISIRRREMAIPSGCGRSASRIAFLTDLKIEPCLVSDGTEQCWESDGTLMGSFDSFSRKGLSRAPL